MVPSVPTPTSSRRAKRSKRGARARQTPDNKHPTLAAHTRVGNPYRRPPITAAAELPTDVWARIARMVAEGGLEAKLACSSDADEVCICSWPLIPAAIALPFIRHALTDVSAILFEDECQCGLSAFVSPFDRIRSFAWLLNQFLRPPCLILNIYVSPPPLLCSAMHSLLFPSLSSLTSVDLFFSWSLVSPPRLLFSLSQAPCLNSLHLSYGNTVDERRDPRRHGGGNDPVLVAEMWELVIFMEAQMLGCKKKGDERREREEQMPPKGKYKEQRARGEVVPGGYFPSLLTLNLSLPAFSPLVFRFLSCLAPQLHSVRLSSTAKQFAALEGGEGTEGSAAVRGGAGSRGQEGGTGGTQRRTFTLHFPLAKTVSIDALDCDISLSAPLLSRLWFYWSTPRARLTLLPSCPAHLPFLFLSPIDSVPWAFHAPHLTALDSFRTNMLPSQAACLPPVVVASVRSLEWQMDLDWNLDLSAWSSLCCLHVDCGGAVLLPVLRSVVWPGGLEGLFLNSIEEDIVGVLKGGLSSRGCEGENRVAMAGTRVRKRGGGMGMEEEGALVSQGGRPVGLVEEPEKHEEDKVRRGDLLEVGTAVGCRSLRHVEGWDADECVLYVWDAAAGCGTEEGQRGDGSSMIMAHIVKFLKARGIAK